MDTAEILNDIVNAAKALREANLAEIAARSAIAEAMSRLREAGCVDLAVSYIHGPPKTVLRQSPRSEVRSITSSMCSVRLRARK